MSSTVSSEGWDNVGPDIFVVDEVIGVVCGFVNSSTTPSAHTYTMGKSRPRFNEKARASARKPTQKPYVGARDGGIGELSKHKEPRRPAAPIVDIANDSSDPNTLVMVPKQNDDNRVVSDFQWPTDKMTSRQAEERRTGWIDGEIGYILVVVRPDEVIKSSRQTETMRERLRRTLAEQRAGLPVSDPDIRLFVAERKAGETDAEAEKVFAQMTLRAEEVAEAESKDWKRGKKGGKEVVEDKVKERSMDRDEEAVKTPKTVVPTLMPIVVGGALKKTVDGLPMPLVKKKRKKKKSTIPEQVRKRHKRSAATSLEDDDDASDDSPFDSSDSENNSDNGEKERGEEEEEERGPTALEQAVEAAKNFVGKIEPRIEEDDEIKKKLLEANQGGDGLVDGERKTFYVKVKRPAEIQQTRMQLPVCGEEQVIMEAINNNAVVIICGETGSGKTTQIPQFLYEAGYSHHGSDNPGLIGITQPRRVAAVSMSKRVAMELGLSENEVSYQIRYDATVSPKTRIKFMTDGVLLRELAQDFLLTNYSAIIIDEAHERSLNTDILIGVVSRVLRLRSEMNKGDKEKVKPLRVIIMSATLRVTDFTLNKTLFTRPPLVLKVDARQYPVSIHFNKRTPAVDHVTEAFKKICKIHTRLPAGERDQRAVQEAPKEVPAAAPQGDGKTESGREGGRGDGGEEGNNDGEEWWNGLGSCTSKSKTSSCLTVAEVEVEDLELGEGKIEAEAELEDFDFDEDSEEDEEGFTDEEGEREPNAPLHVLPLYALLPTAAQLRVFDEPPPGTRLCVVATNVAETSLTIPGVKYVVDCGKVKERRYDAATGVQSFAIGWTSKASADQRAGRAGRTGPGHCYRLYSSAVFDNDFESFSTPEINRMPIEGVVLSMKSMNIDNVTNFPFPTPPDREHMTKAERLLIYLGAIDPDTKRVTDLGRTMAMFPISPRFSKMLLIGQQHNCLPYVIAIVSALSVGDPFVKNYHLDDNHPGDSDDEGSDEEKDIRKQEIKEIRNESVAEKEKRKLMRKQYYKVQTKHAGLDPTSDILKLLNVVGAYEFAGATEKFCEENFLRSKAMEEIHKLRGQITNLVTSNCPGVDVFVDPHMKPPTPTQLRVLRQIIAAGFIDSVAVRADVADPAAAPKRTFKSTRGVLYRVMWSDEEVYVHPSSVLYHREPPAMVDEQDLAEGGIKEFRDGRSNFLPLSHFPCPSSGRSTQLLRRLNFFCALRCRSDCCRTQVACQARQNPVLNERQKGSHHMLRHSGVRAKRVASATNPGRAEAGGHTLGVRAQVIEEELAEGLGATWRYWD
ncbi:P-loop containing nucleoside triphosphate hydrolase protein [Endogone sp. FLAS-F59071]|nr:P-loop containing nucleoside triphosphate hydrolase protein [Endogone sp. FLAS-F59071]|eukprot:RUS17073.1 P-loop containing nucleoside triphosphate hydrolase protein [Endogone sp. FLAS-F59071]